MLSYYGGDTKFTWKTLNASLRELLSFLQKGHFYNRAYIVHNLILWITAINEIIHPRFAWSTALIGNLRVVTRHVSLHVDLVEEWGETPLRIVFALTLIVVAASALFPLYIAHSLMNTHYIPAWLPPFTRLLFGTVLAFHIPFLNVIAYFLMQSSVGDSVASSRTDSATDKATFTFALVALITIVTVLMVASLQHRNDPNSFSIIARAHCRIDFAAIIVRVVFILMLHALPGFPSTIALFFILAQSGLLFMTVVFQPYYDAAFNRFMAALHSSTLWAALCWFVVNLIDNRDDDVVSALFLTGVPTSYGIGYMLSRMALKYWISRGLREPIDDDLLEDLDMFEHLKEAYVDFLKVTWWNGFLATLVEVKTRFLALDTSATALDRAECILRRGMLRFPQSLYLRIQFLSFLVYRRRNYGMASYRFREYGHLPFDWDQQQSMLLLRQSYQKVMNAGHRGAGEVSSETVSSAELKKTRRIASKAGIRTRKLMERLWQSMARGKIPLQELTTLVEKLYESEQLALKSYTYLIQRSPNSNDLTEEYIKFLEEVRDDQAAVEKIRRRLMKINKESDKVLCGEEIAAKSFSASAHSADKVKNAVGARRQSVAMHKKVDDRTALLAGEGEQEGTEDATGAAHVEQFKEKRVRLLKVRVRLVSILLAALIVGVFVMYNSLCNALNTTLVNLGEAGRRLQLCVSTAYVSRGMHLAAINDDKDTFDKEAVKLFDVATSLWSIHNDLKFKYAPTYSNHITFYEDPREIARQVGGDNDVQFNAVSPYDFVQALIQSAKVVSNATMEQFKELDVIGAPGNFSEYHFLQDNGPSAARSMDSSSVYIQAEAYIQSNEMKFLILSSSITCVLIESLVVLCLFRPVVLRLFSELDDDVSMLLGIPMADIRGMIKSKKAIEQLDNERFDEDNVDRDLHVMQEEDDEDEEEPEEEEAAYTEDLLHPRKEASHFLSATQHHANSSARMDAGNSAIATTGLDIVVQANADDKKMDGNAAEGDTVLDNNELNAMNPNENDDEDDDDDDEEDDEDEEDEAEEEEEEDDRFELSETSPFKKEGPLVSLKRAFFGESKDKAKSLSPNKSKEDRHRHSKSIEKEEDEEEKDVESSSSVEETNSRLLGVTITFFFCLVSMAAIMAVYGGYLTMTLADTAGYIDQINQSGRRRYLAHRLQYYTRELFLQSFQPSTTFINSNAYLLNDSAVIRCALRGTAQGMWLSEAFLTLGVNVLHSIPQSHGFDLAQASDACLPFTRNQTLFNYAFRAHGPFHALDDLSFYKSCFTRLSWKDSGDVVATNPRISKYLKDFDDSKCTYYQTNDVTMQFGLHILTEAIAHRAQALSSTPIHHLTSNNSDYKFMKKHLIDSQEYEMGLASALLSFEYQAITIMETSKTTSSLIISLIFIVIIFQMVFLGQRMERLMNENIGMSFLVKRLIRSSKAHHNSQVYHDRIEALK